MVLVSGDVMNKTMFNIIFNNISRYHEYRLMLTLFISLLFVSVYYWFNDTNRCPSSNKKYNKVEKRSKRLFFLLQVSFMSPERLLVMTAPMQATSVHFPHYTKVKELNLMRVRL